LHLSHRVQFRAAGSLMAHKPCLNWIVSFLIGAALAFWNQITWRIKKARSLSSCRPSFDPLAPSHPVHNGRTADKDDAWSHNLQRIVSNWVLNNLIFLHCNSKLKILAE
jgi:hypothetical protein